MYVSAHTVVCCIGIEHDIKIWTPTAEQARPPGREAEELMARNTSQGARDSRVRVNQVMLTPQIIAQLMRMQAMHRAPRSCLLATPNTSLVKQKQHGIIFT